MQSELFACLRPLEFHRMDDYHDIADTVMKEDDDLEVAVTDTFHWYTNQGIRPIDMETLEASSTENHSCISALATASVV
ncbi:hypothetical protein MAR_026623 [Mya arenaria]|uniref:Uncharacterized protein n=1 Tax=Mya arenaria TaxID=6604 RepID=A0ABY7EV79_MYAAR|nr:hypothetical protein MAR_026623 [Mya arenaria]